MLVLVRANLEIFTGGTRKITFSIEGGHPVMKAVSRLLQLGDELKWVETDMTHEDTIPEVVSNKLSKVFLAS